MKQEEVILSDITGKACVMNILVEPTQTIFAQEERSIDEMCNAGDAQLRDFTSYSEYSHS